eukprot:9692601-Lingulodinium_polyedra.AAC.1
MCHGPNDFPRILHNCPQHPHQVTERVGPVGPVLQRAPAAIIVAICQTNAMDAFLHEGAWLHKRNYIH